MPVKTQSIYIYRAKLIAIVDGDTVNIEIDLGFKIRWTTPCRFIGIDVYERREKNGKAAKDFLESLFDEFGALFFLHSDRDQIAIYNRVAGRIYIETKTGFVDVIQTMRKAGFEKGATPNPDLKAVIVTIPTRDIVQACLMGARAK